jgi:hypothetical protein
MKLSQDGQQRTHLEPRSRVEEQARAPVHLVRRIAFAHAHLVDASIGARGGHCQLSAHGPERKETDAEFTLHAARAFLFQAPFNRVADVCGDVLEVGNPVFVARHSATIVGDLEEVFAAFSSACDGDRPRSGIDAVLDELGDSLERVVLGQRDDRDRVPVVADAQSAARGWLDGH